MELDAKIEGLLFYKAEDITIKKLSEIFNTNEEDVKNAIIRLKENLKNRGLVLIEKDDKVILGINNELNDIINQIRKDEITKDLSKASLETLSIILYKNGVTRSEIDYIRGVNSSFILRNLLIRGLIEKKTDSEDSRRILYCPTIDTLSYMGISRIEDLPNYEKIVFELKEIINQQKENND